MPQTNLSVAQCCLLFISQQAHSITILRSFYLKKIVIRNMGRQGRLVHAPKINQLIGQPSGTTDASKTSSCESLDAYVAICGDDVEMCRGRSHRLSWREAWAVNSCFGAGLHMSWIR